MKIDQIINLWNKSKYKYLWLKSMPVVNHKGEITWGTGIYHKGETILCVGEYKVEDYLKKIYKESIFMFEETAPIEDYISFRIILKGE